MAQSIKLAASGLNISMNPLARPEGALTEASNVIIRRDGIVEPRRGFHLYGNDSTTNSDKLFEYRKRLLRHNVATVLQYDSDGLGTFLNFNGSYSNPASGYKIKNTEANGNFYFTTSNGVKKISTVDGSSIAADSIQNAGVPKALSGTGVAHVEIGDSTGFLPGDSAVAYRVLWGYKDDNNNLIVGAPSDRIVVRNSQTSLMAQDVLNLYKILIEMRTLNPILATPIDTIFSQFPDMEGLPSTVAPQGSGNTCKIIGLNVTSSLEDVYKALNEIIYYIEGVGGLVLASRENGLHGSPLFSPIILEHAQVMSVASNSILHVDLNPLINVTKFITSASYKIQDLGTTSISDWHTAGVSAGVVPERGVIFTCSGTPITGTGAAYLLSVDPVTNDELFISGGDYEIVSVGSTNWVSVGVDASVTPAPGVRFKASGIGSGSGTARYLKKNSGIMANTYFQAGQNINLIDWLNNGVPISKSAPSVNLDNLSIYNFPIQSVISNISTGENEINIDISSATALAQTPSANILSSLRPYERIVNGELTKKNVNITSSSFNTAPYSASIDLLTYLSDILKGVREYSYRGLVAANYTRTQDRQLYTDTFLIADIASLSIAPGSPNLATVTFNVNDARRFFKVGDLIEITNMLSGGIEIPSLNMVKSVTQYTITFETTAAAGTGIITDSSIYKTIITTDVVYKKFIQDSSVTPPVLLTETTSASVDLTLLIPAEITASNPKYFYQIYRSATIATSAVTGLSDLVPYDEMRLLFESFPTTNELLLRQILHNDNVAEPLTGSNLYTNNVSGQGILAANAPLPYAKDINRWKNRTWLANTRTTQKATYTFLGIDGIVSGDKITIASLDGSNTYEFVTGINQSSTIRIEKKAVINGVVSSITKNASYTIIDTALPNSLATNDFVTLSLTDSFPVVDGLWATSVSTNTQFTIPTLIDVNGTQGLYYYDIHKIVTNDYVSLHSTNDLKKYVFWFVNDNETATQPSEGADSIYVRLDISRAQSSVEVMDVLTAAISETGDFIAVSSLTESLINVTNINYGIATNPATNNSPAFTFTTTSGAGEDLANQKILLSPAVSAGTSLTETVASLLRTINYSAQLGNEQVYAYTLYNDTTGSIGTIGSFYLEAKTLSPNPFYVISSAAALGADFNAPIYEAPAPGKAGLITANSMANPTVITSNGHGLVTGDYVIISNSNSTTSIDGLHQITWLSANTFSIPVNVTVAGTTGYWMNETQAEISDNNLGGNIVYYSKYNEPEAFPLLNSLRVGLDSKEILRIYPLRDSLFVFKEDGCYRISGETEPFSIGLFDASCICNAEESLAVANNVIYLSTTQGISAVTESGVSIISRAIDVDILKYATSNYNYYGSATFGLGYDSDNSYYIWMPNTLSATVPNICYRYSNLTSSWTTFDKTNTAALVYSVNDKLYLAAGDVNYLEKERKDFEHTDYADREYVVSISSAASYSVNLLTMADVSHIAIGDAIVQGNLETTIAAVNSITKVVTLNDPLAFSASSVCTIYAAIDANLQYAPEHMGDPMILKHVRETTMMFEDLAFTGGILSYASDLLPTFIDVPFTADGGNALFAGALHGAPIRTYVPRDSQRCRYLIIRFNHKYAREKFSILGTTLVAADSPSTRGYK